MTNGAKQPSNSAEADGLVGEAWTVHFHGQHEDAIRQFEQILQRWPDHIDANYGLALSLKYAGQKEKSAEAFRKTKALVEAAQSALQEDAESSRYQMLTRLCDQNIALL